MAEIILHKPQMTVDPGTSEEVALRIRTIDRNIHHDPGTFVVALNVLGESATVKSNQLHDRENLVPIASKKPADIILEFFRNRYDNDVQLDDASEEAIAADPGHRKLLAIMREKKSHRVSEGNMNSVLRVDPEAEPARDAVRRSRFGLYLARVAIYNRQLSDSQLPSVS